MTKVMDKLMFGPAMRSALGAAALGLLIAGTPTVAVAQAVDNAQAAAQRVKEQTGGRILGVRSSGGRYLVKVMTSDGRVRVVAVPARR
jgi:hypothetical protein